MIFCSGVSRWKTTRGSMAARTIAESSTTNSGFCYGWFYNIGCMYSFRLFSSKLITRKWITYRTFFSFEWIVVSLVFFNRTRVDPIITDWVILQILRFPWNIVLFLLNLNEVLDDVYSFRSAMAAARMTPMHRYYVKKQGPDTYVILYRVGLSLLFIIPLFGLVYVRDIYTMHG